MFGLFGGPKVSVITPEEVQEHLSAAGAPLILDVREPGEYAGGHIPGSRLIPLGTLSTRLAEIPKGQEIVTVCRSGARSGMAAKLLLEAGYPVKNMAGGMMAWRGPVDR